MTYKIDLSFKSNANLVVDKPTDAMQYIEKLDAENGIVYLYNQKTGDQLEVSLTKNGYFVRDFLRNGFYKIQCDRLKLSEILTSFEDPERDPEKLGMESFE